MTHQYMEIKIKELEKRIDALEKEHCEYKPFTIDELEDDDIKKLLRLFQDQKVLDSVIPKQQSCEDAISRQAVLDMHDNAQIITDGEYCGYCTEDIDINILPPVQPQPKIGRWLKGKPECPNCGIDRYQDLDADIYSEWYPNYCPNCGQPKMQEVSE